MSQKCHNLPNGENLMEAMNKSNQRPIFKDSSREYFFVNFYQEKNNLSFPDRKKIKLSTQFQISSE
jgi:hypothetical protein